MRSRTKLFAAALATTGLGGCGLLGGGHATDLKTAGDMPPADGAPPPSMASLPQDFPVVLGAPYRIGGAVFAPFDRLSFDEVGYAAVIPPGMAGRRTVNNETISPSTFSGAHRTLPVPSYVEVTSLENGRTILVRINDRGPMLADRNIALSVAAAQALGLGGNGTSAVRVRRVNPPEQERALLRAGGKAATRLETPPGLRNALKAKLPPVPAPLREAVAMQGDHGGAVVAASPERVAAVFVPPSVPASPAMPAPPAWATDARPAATADRFITEQAGSRHTGPTGQTNEANETSAAAPTAPFIVEQAGAMPGGSASGASFAPPPMPGDAPSVGRYAIQIGAFADAARAAALADTIDGTVTSAGGIHRVRTQGYRTMAQAQAALPALRAKGYADARVVVNDGG